jgi:hypothetical protein
VFCYSPYYNDHVAYWIGASDKHFEGDFKWSDGMPFSYTSKSFIMNNDNLFTHFPHCQNGFRVGNSMKIIIVNQMMMV